MGSVLGLTVIVNSGVEAVFAAKCCAISDANLEIILANSGDSPITVTGCFSLQGDSGIEPLNLYPQGARAIGPGEAAAFYGSMDPGRWTTWRTLTVTDAGGHHHRFDLPSSTE